MKAAVCLAYGDSATSIHLEDRNLKEPGWNEVRVRMLLSPVNPSDLLFLQGKYGNQPELPVVPGFEGVGIVEAGRGPLAWRVLGKRVSVIGPGDGRWQQKIILPARQAVPVPHSLSETQAASFFVNPATAFVMTQKVLRIPPGQWLLQSGSTGALGKMVMRLGKKLGFRTINIVRRDSQGELVKQEGGTESVSLESENMVDKVKAITGGQGVLYAMDAIGGQVGSGMISCLGRHGTMLVYGRMSGEPLVFEPGAIMKGEKTIRGFWLSEWVKDQGIFTMLCLFRKLGKLIGDGTLDTPAGPIFELDQVQQALQAARESSNHQKIYLRLNPA
ncbi:MAG: zinc-binding dehydrogenase [Gemmataceae bacterium]|nr:zinc-binding dehydrogenase [Gemmataceae bacterium]